MDFTYLQQHYHELLDYMEKEGYTESYIRRIHEDIKWILKNEKYKSWNSYIDVYYDRVQKSKSEPYKKNQRTAFGHTAIRPLWRISEQRNWRCNPYFH